MIAAKAFAALKLTCRNTPVFSDSHTHSWSLLIGEIIRIEGSKAAYCSAQVWQLPRLSWLRLLIYIIQLTHRSPNEGQCSTVSMTSRKNRVCKRQIRSIKNRFCSLLKSCSNRFDTNMTRIPLCLCHDYTKMQIQSFQEAQLFTLFTFAAVPIVRWKQFVEFFDVRVRCRTIFRRVFN